MLINIKGIIDEDFVNYKKPCMYVAFPKCSFKCGSFCQNSSLAKSADRTIETDDLAKRYANNSIAEAIVVSGLEPFDTYKELEALIKSLRMVTDDDIVIYTGYYYDEISVFVKKLAAYPNIVIKYGRYIPNSGPPVYDDVLGVTLISSNQYAERIS